MDQTKMDANIISAIIGAVIGGGLSAFGYYFKNKREVREKINESLFQLLEVWSLIAMIKVTSSDKFHATLLDAIKGRFPHENIGENDKALLKEGMVKSLPMLSGTEAKIDGQFMTKYKSSVNDLAKIFPLLAFELNRNQMLIQFLGAIDKLVSNSPFSDTEKAMLDNMREFMLDESFVELESDLLTLSSASGYGNKRRTKKHIERTRNKLDAIPGEVFDVYINKVIEPAVQAHYDALGIENPNSVKPNNAIKRVEECAGVVQE